MRRYFDEDKRESSRGTGDTELTLGSGMLLTVFFGLVLLCGLCFGLGYAVGSRGSKGPAFQSQPPAAGPSPQVPVNSPQGKPSAAEAPPAVATQPVTTDQAATAAPGAEQAAGPTPATGVAQAAAVGMSAPAASQ